MICHTLSMIRRTITLPDELAVAVEQAVADGAAANVSRFFQQAAAHELEALRRRRLAEEAARLDADEEVALTRGENPQGEAPWGRLG